MRGFSLVELMVVVAIVAVLALIATVTYRRLIASSRTAEALQMVHAIRAAQEAYHAETLRYANVSPDLTTTYPAAAPGAFVTAWGAPCTSCNANVSWATLSVHVDGPVAYGYATTAGVAGTAPNPASVTVNGQAVAFPTPSPTDWFVIGATGDTNGDGIPCNVYGMSWTNDVFVSGEGN